MVNYNLINRAIKLAISYYEANNYVCDSYNIERRVKDWYNHTDIVDAELLAAAAINSEYDCSIDYDLILMWREVYFFDTPIEYSGNIHVSELIDCY